MSVLWIKKKIDTYKCIGLYNLYAAFLSIYLFIVGEGNGEAFGKIPFKNLDRFASIITVFPNHVVNSWSCLYEGLYSSIRHLYKSFELEWQFFFISTKLMILMEGGCIQWATVSNLIKKIYAFMYIGKRKVAIYINYHVFLRLLIWLCPLLIYVLKGN